ncbi:MAG: hypothetical protein QM504_18710 [Pseudomonadota bacterium]
MLTIDIKVGCKEFLDTQWSEIFYPDDLPDDWKLDYYANELSTVLLNSKYNQEINTLLEECFADDFNIVLLADQKVAKQKADNKLIINNEVSVKIDFVSRFDQVKDFTFLQKTQTYANHPVYYYQAKNLLTPVQLKELLLFCVDESGIEKNAIKDKNQILYLFFSDHRHAIENVRNMNILIQML